MPRQFYASCFWKSCEPQQMPDTFRFQQLPTELQLLIAIECQNVMIRDIPKRRVSVREKRTRALATRLSLACKGLRKFLFAETLLALKQYHQHDGVAEKMEGILMSDLTTFVRENNQCLQEYRISIAFYLHINSHSVYLDDIRNPFHGIDVGYPPQGVFLLVKDRRLVRMRDQTPDVDLFALDGDKNAILGVPRDVRDRVSLKLPVSTKHVVPYLEERRTVLELAHQRRLKDPEIPRTWYVVAKYIHKV